MHPIKQIAEYGIPVNSYLAAIQYLNRRSDLEQSQYENMIETLTGFGNDFPDHRIAKYTFLYLIQETIRESNNTDKFDMGKLLTLSFNRAEKFIKENPWHWAQPDEVVKVDDAGKPKRKKGAKQEMALELYKEYIEEGKPKVIDMFMSELDMSKAGATTYFYNTKKKVNG